ncbi:uncharacterized protein SAPINGB_P003801 [Magnusiomyces paraingens]|uniref:EamA domain-containing protein n=1 Tax=Magnusiomyces paraingens TaxID=2606893 RepID=A0A5E8BTF3_9ASCO|nr:uncharacterized protein SAPINGB_P003801 [Saprochaete ingens]VVT53889.1 unnamed protein product [Saprochaete ingens]
MPTESFPDPKETAAKRRPAESNLDAEEMDPLTSLNQDFESQDFTFATSPLSQNTFLGSTTNTITSLLEHKAVSLVHTLSDDTVASSPGSSYSPAADNNTLTGTTTGAQYTTADVVMPVPLTIKPEEDEGNVLLDEEQRVGGFPDSDPSRLNHPTAANSDDDSYDGLDDDSDGPLGPLRKESIRERAMIIINHILFSHAGVKLLLLAQVFNSAMIASTRLLETASDPPFHPFQVLFARMGITYIGCVAFMWYKHVPDFLLGEKGIRLLLVCRGVFGFFGVFGLYYSVNYLEISDAAVITFLTPVFTAVFAWHFLNEPLLPIEILGGLFALIGVVIISKPSFLFKIGHHSESSNDTPDIPEAMRVRAVLVALLGVCGASSVYIVIRKIGRRAHPLISVSYFALWSFIVSTVGLTVTPGLHFVMPQTALQWFLLLLLGVFGFLFQFCLTAGIQRVTAGRAAMATYTLMFWTLLWEKVIWHKTPDLWSLLGMVLILGSGIFVAVYKWWSNKKAREARIHLPHSRRTSHISTHDRNNEDEDQDDDEHGGEGSPLLGDQEYQGDEENALSSDLESDIDDDDDSRERRRYSFTISHQPSIPLRELGTTPPATATTTTTTTPTVTTASAPAPKRHNSKDRIRATVSEIVSIPATAPAVPMTGKGVMQVHVHTGAGAGKVLPRSAYTRVYDRSTNRNDFLSTSSTVV